jgi:hypothetical protein
MSQVDSQPDPESSQETRIRDNKEQRKRTERILKEFAILVNGVPAKPKYKKKKRSWLE